MAKALGTTKDGEYQTNLHQLAKVRRNPKPFLPLSTLLPN